MLYNIEGASNCETICNYIVNRLRPSRLTMISARSSSLISKVRTVENLIPLLRNAIKPIPEEGCVMHPKGSH